MEPKEAEQEKILIAEKQISYVRAIIIVFGTFTLFMLNGSGINYPLCYTLIFLIWSYGLFVILYKPYEKHPVFLAGWFTYLSDCIFASLWIYATGGFYSPYYVLFYTSIVAVAFRFNLRTTMFTSVLYTAAYMLLIFFLQQLHGNEAVAVIRTGFIFIMGFLTHLITFQTLAATRQKLKMKELMEEAQKNHAILAQKQEELNALNIELKLQNDIFSHAEENAAIGSYSWDLANNKLFYSDNLFRLLGYEPGEFEPTSERFRDMLHRDDKQVFEKLQQDLLKENKLPQSLILRVICTNGEMRHLSATARFTQWGEKKVLIGTLQDVTAEIKVRQELQEKNREFEQSNKELSSFSYVASHDLQEPVRKILTFAELVLEKERGKLQEFSIGYMNRIVGAAKRMKSLIHAFLNYSRVDNTAPQFEAIDLNAVIEDTKNTLLEQITDKHAIIETAHLPVITGVQLQLQQLFINLIGNALKYNSTAQQPEIRIMAERINSTDPDLPSSLEKTDHWKITVKDNGIGFEPQYSEKIFEVFQRLHSNEHYEGTGIGLAICKKIVQTHRGHICAKGEKGNGATFTIYFPADPEIATKA